MFVVYSCLESPSLFLYVSFHFTMINKQFPSVKPVSLGDYDTNSEIGKLESLQYVLRSLDSSNYTEEFDKLMESDWIRKKDLVSILVHTIILICSCSIKKRAIYSQLLLDLNQKADESNKLVEIVPELRKSVDWALMNKGDPIIYDAIDNGLLTDEDIKKFVRRKVILQENVYRRFMPEYVALKDEFDINCPNIIDVDNLEESLRNRKECANESEIARVIRNDDIVALQEISLNPGFSFSSSIPYSDFEIDPFLWNDNTDILSYAAYHSSIKCFKFIYLNRNNRLPWNLDECAISGGNLEIVRICEQQQKIKVKKPTNAIVYHQYEIFDWLMERGISEKYEKDAIAYEFIHSLRNITLPHSYNVSEYLLHAINSDNHIIFKFIYEKYQPKDYDLAFSHACTYGAIKIAKYLISLDSTDLNRECEESSPFHNAMENLHVDVVKLLLNTRGIEFRRIKMVPPFYIACSLGMIELVELLYNTVGFDYNAGSKPNTPFTIACFYGNIKIVDFLINNKLKCVNIRDGIMTAFKNSKIKTLKKLTEYYFVEEDMKLFIELSKHAVQATQLNLELSDFFMSFPAIKENQSVISIYVEEAMKKSMIELLFYFLDINDKEFFNKVVEDSYFKKLYTMEFDFMKEVHKNYNIDLNKCSKTGQTALQKVIATRDLEKILFVVDNVDYCSEDNEAYETILNMACKSNDLGIIKKIMEKANCNINRRNSTENSIFVSACLNSKPTIINYLTENSTVNANSICYTSSNTYTTLLTKMIINKKIEIIKKLLEMPGIDVNLESMINTSSIATPLLVAIEYKLVDVVILLLEHPNIDVNQDCKYSSIDKITMVSPLMLAIMSNQNNIISLLLSHKDINVNTRINGWTPLTLAINMAKRENNSIIELLLSNPKIDVNKTTNCPLVIMSPLFLACQSFNLDLISKLIEFPNIDFGIPGTDCSIADLVQKSQKFYSVLKLLQSKGFLLDIACNQNNLQGQTTNKPIKSVNLSNQGFTRWEIKPNKPTSTWGSK